MAWAVSKGIAKGYGANRFGPEDTVTREQMAVMLYNYAKGKGVDVSVSGTLSSFADSGEVSAWAAEALTWAGERGLMNGVGNGILAPRSETQRAQTAALMNRLSGIMA